jgi:hypothetical protein
MIALNKFTTFKTVVFICRGDQKFFPLSKIKTNN